MTSNPESRTHNLPLVHEGMQFLTRMRPGDPVCTSITTIRRILQHMNLDTGPGELVRHCPLQSPLLGPIPHSGFVPQMISGLQQQQQPPLQLVEEPDLAHAPDTDFQFDLDFSAANFNVDITAIDWGTFFSYAPM